MTLARVGSSPKNDLIQSISPASAPAASQGDLLAEFSSLVEKIAGQIQVSSSPLAPLDLGMVPSEAPQAKREARKEAPRADKSSKAPAPQPESADETQDAGVAAPETRVEDLQAQDVEAAKAPKNDEKQAAPETETAATIPSGETQIQVATAAVRQANPSTQPQAPEGTKADEIPEEGIEAFGQQLAGNQQAPVPTSNAKVSAEKPARQSERSLASEAPAAEKAPAAAPTSTETTSSAAATKSQGEATSVSLAGEQYLSEATAKTLKALLSTQATQLLPQRTESLDRDAMLSALVAKPLLDMQLRGTENASKTAAGNQITGADAAGFKAQGSRSSSNESSARNLRTVARVNSDRMLEKVEGALKEVSRSRDGTSLSFRLDPPQLGSVKVDVTLRDGALHARVTPENAQVAQLIRERANELHQNLRRLGLDVETVTVSVGGDNFSDTLGSDQSSLSQDQGTGGERRGGSETFGQAAGTSTAWAESTTKPSEDYWVA